MTTTSSPSVRCSECGAPRVSADAPCPRCGALPAHAPHSPIASDPAAAASFATLRRWTLWVLAAGALVRAVSMVGAPPWWPLDLLGLVGLWGAGRWVRAVEPASTWPEVASLRRVLGWIFGAMALLTAAGGALVWRVGGTGGGALVLSALHLGVALGGLGVALRRQGAR